MARKILRIITSFEALNHYNDVIMGAMVSEITSLPIVYSTVYLGADQRKHQIPASLAFVRGIYRWPVDCPHKGPVTQEMLPFGDVIMMTDYCTWTFVSTSEDSAWFKIISCGINGPYHLSRCVHNVSTSIKYQSNWKYEIQYIVYWWKWSQWKGIY